LRRGTLSVIEKFLNKVGFTRFGLYVQDYSGPVGLRIVGRHPEWLEWLIIQNTNAYEIGFTTARDELRSNYWKTRSAESENAISAFLEPETVKAVFTTTGSGSGILRRKRPGAASRAIPPLASA